MAEVWIPTNMRDLTGGQSQVTVSGSTLRQVVKQLDQKFPGIKSRLVQGDDLSPGIAAVVDGETSTMGLLERVAEDSEIHFLPAIGGG